MPSPAAEGQFLVVTPRLQIPLDEFLFSFVRSSGPGGQNVNKVSSKAVLRWRVTTSPSLPSDVRQRLLARQRRRISGEGDLIVTGQRYREAPRNEVDCLEKVRMMVLEATSVPRARKPTKPTRSSVRRRIQDKKRASDKKRGRADPREES